MGPRQAPQLFASMAKLTLLDLPEELIRAILVRCRTWSHPALKSRDAVPIDFAPESEFHLEFGHADYLSVLLTCKTFHRIAEPLAYDCVRLLNPTFKALKRYPTFREYYTLVPTRGDYPVHSSITNMYDTSIVQWQGEILLSRTLIIFRPRPQIAQNCRALRIDPRVYVK